MSPTEERRFVHRWFVLQYGGGLAGGLEARLADAVPLDAAASADGLLEDLRCLLLLAYELALGREHRGAGDLWIALGATKLLEALWLLVAERGWPGVALAVRGVREGWLHRLDPERAAGLREEEQERTEEAWRDVPRADLAAALAHDAVRTGNTLAGLGDDRGAIARDAGAALLDHLARLNEVERRWQPVGDALSVAHGR